jgi:RNA polymerase sigma factor (sigma-70 family)
VEPLAFSRVYERVGPVLDPEVVPPARSNWPTEGQLRTLVRFAAAVAGDATAAEDLAAEAIARTVEASRRQSVEHPDAYARRVLANLHIGDLRRRRRTRAHIQKLLTTDATSDANDELVLRLRLRAEFRALDLNHRVVLALRFFEERTLEETAALLEVPVGTVKSRTARALAQLRTALADEVVEDPDESR